mmetsp:Transcript_33631/g.81504  ORF Transcript_33631/g.81504 Transcript_33631/m.81504 type:complete len:408 (-) Transcript_33631:78-1301(-)
MILTTTLAFTTFLLSNTHHQVSATSVKMDFLPAAVARTDPIITNTCLSDHVHTFYGPQVIRPETTYEDLRNSPDEINSGNVQENKSLYWHPTPYSYNKDTNTYTKDEIAQTSAYYVWPSNAGVKAFPNGFKMIAGTDPTAPGQFVNTEATCVDPTPCERAEGCYTENTFFPNTACEELEVGMNFPTCWDGVNIDSSDHQSHVAYTLDGDVEGACPSTHPVRLPQIIFVFRIMPYSGGWHTFSDMSSVYHADYFSGWDEKKLQEVLDTCVNESMTATNEGFCKNHLTFRDAPKCIDEDAQGCDFGDLSKLKAFQPPALDVKAIVSAEETTTVANALPRGTCTGTLIAGGNTSSGGGTSGGNTGGTTGGGTTGGGTTGGGTTDGTTSAAKSWSYSGLIMLAILSSMSWL